MPQVIDYPLVLDRMSRQGFRCHYYNSGAFGFTDASGVRVVGWIGPADPTIRQEMLARTRPVPSPWEVNLSRLLVQTWQKHLPGPLWVMPKSHWAHELHHGSAAWMPSLLEQAGVDPALLAGRTDAAAIEFGRDDSECLAPFVFGLLERLEGSDFMIAFPGQPVLCALHHHKQLWWVTSDAVLANALEDAIRPL